jgi:hypothetical protein
MISKHDVSLADDVRLSADGDVNVPLVLSISGAANITWGHSGSGPRDLAFNILIAAGLEPDEAADLHEQFMMEFLYDVPQHAAGRIDRKAIRHWIWLQRVCPHLEWEDLLRQGRRCIACNVTEAELRRRDEGGYRRKNYRPWE